MAFGRLWLAGKAAVLMAAACLVSGCIDLNIDLSIKRDGGGELNYALAIPADIVGRLENRAAEDAVCQLVPELKVAANVNDKRFVDYTANAGLKDGKCVYEFRLVYNDLKSVADWFNDVNRREWNNPEILGAAPDTTITRADWTPLSVTELGDERVRIDFDLFGTAGQLEIAKLAQLHIFKFIQPLLGDGKIRISVQAYDIIETTGRMTQDKRTAYYEAKFTDVLDPQSNKTFQTELAYAPQHDWWGWLRSLFGAK